MDKIKNCLAQYLGIDSSDINEDSNLVNELDLTSFDLINLTCEIEAMFEINIDIKDINGIKTVRELAEIVYKKQEL